jgi:triosephosphate isomerase (TIM)
MRKKLAIGNWKMNGSLAEARALTSDIVRHYSDECQKHCDLVLCPPFVHIPAVQPILAASPFPIGLGAQNCSDQNEGAFTGEVSAPMIRDLGCNMVILGHSERRTLFQETDTMIQKKLMLALKNNLKPIVCIGETLSEREAGREFDVVQSQILALLSEPLSSHQLIWAYEPVWAIGTGKVASSEDVASMHQKIHDLLAEKCLDSEHITILYGGSVKAENVLGLMGLPHVDGALIGGASLKADSFLAIANAAAQVT